MKKLMRLVLSALCLVLSVSGAFGESVDYWYLTNKQTVDATRITTGAGIGGGVGGKGAPGAGSSFGSDFGPSGNGGDGGDGGMLLVSGGTVTGSGVTGIGGGDGGSGYGGTNPGASGNPGAETKVTLDETKVEVAEGMYGNGHPYVKIAEKKPVGPTCEGGTIAWSDAANAWVVTPNVGVTAVTVTGLSEGDFVAVPTTVTKVSGVADAQIKVRSGAYDITGAFAVTGGAIALNPNGVVTIGGEEIPVKPTIGDLDEGEPFVVGKGAVMVTVKAIPGLRYELRRGESVKAVCGGETPPPQGMDVPQESPAPQRVICESVVATGARVALTDANPPAGKAFYIISVSCPAAVGPSDSTIRIVGGRVYSGQYDITDAVTIRGDGTVELKAGGVVGGVKVTPVIGDLPPSSDGEGGTATPPFTVGSDGAALAFETIPGLCYGLLRGETPDTVDALVDWHWAESRTMTLRDFNPPEVGALYRIVVRVEGF